MAITSLIPSRTALFRFLMDGSRRHLRYFSDKTGKVFGEEERAKENMYIKKMENEKLEKQKAEKGKDKSDKKPEGGSDKKCDGSSEHEG